jgi:hypothetical protein
MPRLPPFTNHPASCQVGFVAPDQTEPDSAQFAPPILSAPPRAIAIQVARRALCSAQGGAGALIFIKRRGSQAVFSLWQVARKSFFGIQEAGGDVAVLGADCLEMRAAQPARRSTANRPAVALRVWAADPPRLDRPIDDSASSTSTMRFCRLAIDSPDAELWLG